MLKDKKIVLGVCGSIAAYKAVDLLRQLILRQAEVKVVMTQSACQFISPVTFQALSKNEVYTDQFIPKNKSGMDHIELAKWTDSILIAPASANILAKLAHGLADDLLSTICLATEKPIFLAPAMNKSMWNNPFTQENIKKIQSNGIELFGPIHGLQACGDEGVGHLLAVEEVLSCLESKFYQANILYGKRILITAGPTRELMDPIRYITNYSSGKMGYALASAATQLGAEVMLISGPTDLPPPNHVNLVKVNSASEMYQAVMNNIHEVDIFISNAAVADYQIKEIHKQKIKKKTQELILTLVPTKDILYEVSLLSKPPFLVGFAAETERLIEYAQEKLKKKKLDMVVANLVGKDRGFNQDDIQLTMIMKSGEYEEFPYLNKNIAAKVLLNAIAREFNGDK